MRGGHKFDDTMIMIDLKNAIVIFVCAFRTNYMPIIPPSTVEKRPLLLTFSQKSKISYSFLLLRPVTTKDRHFC